MFLAAFTSALPVYAQDRQAKTAWLSRALASTKAEVSAPGIQ
jgi:hypothetical protein